MGVGEGRDSGLHRAAVYAAHTHSTCPQEEHLRAGFGSRAVYDAWEGDKATYEEGSAAGFEDKATYDEATAAGFEDKAT